MEQTPDKQRILIIEDEAAVAKGLEYGLQDEGFEVFWAAAGEAGLRMLQEHSPHLLLLDIRLPDINGFDLCRKLRAQGHRLPIIMLTARDEDADKVLGLEIGADDYVVKPFSFRELVSRVRAMLRRSYGELAGSTAVQRLAFGNVVVDAERLKVLKSGHEVFLTPTEFKILKYLIERPDQPVSRDTLIDEIWGYDLFYGYERTIDVHIRHLREKLEADPAQPHWIVTVRGHGYKFSSGE